jgi:hypothetical protein
MAYDEGLAERVRECLQGEPLMEEKRMFSGLCVMLNGNMCCGIVESVLMIRVPKDRYDNYLACEYVREMDFTGKPLKGFLYVEEEGIAEDSDLAKWVGVARKHALSLPPK